MFTNKSKTFGHTVKGNEPRTPPLSLPFILGRNLTLGGGVVNLSSSLVVVVNVTLTLWYQSPGQMVLQELNM